MLNLRNSENGGSISSEHKGAGPIERLGAVIKHIGTLLTEAPDRYKKAPTAQEYAQMSTNKGCGSGIDNGETEEQMQKLADEEKKKRDQYMHGQRNKNEYNKNNYNGGN